MENYQILVIIGAILGLLITIVGLGVIAFLDSFVTSLDKNSQTPSETSIRAKQIYYLAAGAIVFYIASLAVTFGSKNLKFVGVFLIISSIMVLILTSLYGLFGFALLLPTGIIALRKRNKPAGITTSI